MPTWRVKSGKYYRRGEVDGQTQLICHRPGDTFEAEEWEVKGVLSQLEMVTRDWFEVINPATGEPINDRPLTEEEADALINKEAGEENTAEDQGSEDPDPGQDE
ncbi:MAG: hypothetical protein JRJ78_15840 [Deltaproteobacteria bacterium]|nr:hypothetical protein [Deltaproteobacteria bacterium]